MEEELLILEHEYSKIFHNNINIYPEYWENSNNIDLKIKLLKKAIKEKKLILELKGAEEFVEEVFI